MMDRLGHSATVAMKLEEGIPLEESYETIRNNPSGCVTGENGQDHQYTVVFLVTTYGCECWMTKNVDRKKKSFIQNVLE